MGCVPAQAFCVQSMYRLVMPRPEISDETIEALDTWVKPNISVSIGKLSTDEKLRILLGLHKDLHEWRLKQMNRENTTIVAPDVTPPTEDE